MDTQSQMREGKAAANGKWKGVKDAAQSTVKEGEKIADQAVDQAASLGAAALVGQDVVDFVQEHAGDIVKAGADIAKTASNRVASFVKKYPVQTAAAGVAVALFVGWRIAAQQKKSV